jgi:hypothetical protein
MTSKAVVIIGVKGRVLSGWAKRPWTEFLSSSV